MVRQGQAIILATFGVIKYRLTHSYVRRLDIGSVREDRRHIVFAREELSSSDIYKVAQ